MKTLIPTLAIAFFLSFLSERRSSRRLNEFGQPEYVRKDRFFFFLMAFAMAFFVGLRTRGNDTLAYRIMYENQTPGTNPIQMLTSMKIASSPGLYFLAACLKNIGATTQDYFMACAMFTILTYLWFLRKHTTDIWLSVFYFITMGVYTFTMAAIKQTLAVAFLLIATDRAFDRKWLKYFLWVAVAELFHPYAFVYLVVPFLSFCPWSRKTWYLLAGTVAAALFLPRLMDVIGDMTDALGYDYDEDAFTGGGVNTFRVIVVWVPLVLSYICKEQLRGSESREQNMIVNLSMINSVIMFIGLFGTANYFARLANYFLMFQCLALPMILQKFDRKSERTLRFLSEVGFLGFFYYGTAVAQGKFDVNFSFISVSEFLDQLFKG